MAEAKPVGGGGLWDAIFQALGGHQKAATNYEPNPQYPTVLDGHKYGAGQFYGTPWAPYAEGHAARVYKGPEPHRFGTSSRFGDLAVEPQRGVQVQSGSDVEQDATDYYRAGLAAANRSALSSLGLRSLSKAMIDPRPSQGNLGGATRRRHVQL